MSGAVTVLILRPGPAAAVTEGKARAAGFATLVHPLFILRPLAWAPPDAPASALLLTSANAVRLAGPLPPAVLRLPVFAVGRATASAAEAAGLTTAWTGDSDGTAAARALTEAGHNAAWHLRGRDARALSADVLNGLHLTPVVTYAAEPADAPLPPLAPGTVALLHSPRAAARLAELVPPPARADLALVAISEGTARAAGGDWAAVEVAKRPDDAAMLARVAHATRPLGAPRHR